MWLNETLKIKYPLIQGGMANIATGAFAAAVSNAGGLGLIAGGGMSPEMLRENIREAKKLTDKPFGVNLMYKGLCGYRVTTKFLENLAKQINNTLMKLEANK